MRAWVTIRVGSEDTSKVIEARALMGMGVTRVCDYRQAAAEAYCGLAARSRGIGR